MYTRNRGVGCISSAHTRAACGNDSDSGRRAHIGGVPSSQLVSRLIRWCRPRKRILASNHPLRALAVSRFQSKTRTKGNSQSDSGIGNTGNNRAALPLRRWTKPYLSIVLSVRKRLDLARPESSASSAKESGCVSAMRARRARLRSERTLANVSIDVNQDPAGALLTRLPPQESAPSSVHSQHPRLGGSREGRIHLTFGG